MEKEKPLQKKWRPNQSFSSPLRTTAGYQSNMESRRDCRKPYFIPVDYATTDRLYQEFIFNISAGGVYIETRQPLPVGQKISLTFALPNQPIHIKTTGGVVRTDTKGIGIAFLTIDPAARRLINEAIVSL